LAERLKPGAPQRRAGLSRPQTLTRNVAGLSGLDEDVSVVSSVTSSVAEVEVVPASVVVVFPG